MTHNLFDERQKALNVESGSLSHLREEEDEGNGGEISRIPNASSPGAPDHLVRQSPRVVPDDRPSKIFRSPPP